MPYILVLLPLTAVLFGAIPYAGGVSLGFLLATLLLLNVTKQSVRGPVVALMPDTIPADYRSEANGVINTMGGIASIVGTIGLARLMDLDTTLPLLGATKDRLPFPLAGIFVVLAVILLFAFIREKKSDPSAAQEQKTPILESFRNVAAQKDKSALYILISLFLWFLGYQGVLPFIGKYSIDILKTSSGTAALAAGMVGVAYAIFALPSGYVAHRIGRKKTIRASLLVIAVLTALLFVHPWITASLPGSLKLGTFWAIMFLPHALADGGMGDNRHLHGSLLYREPGCGHPGARPHRRHHRHLRLSGNIPFLHDLHALRTLCDGQGDEGRACGKFRK